MPSLQTQVNAGEHTWRRLGFVGFTLDHRVDVHHPAVGGGDAFAVKQGGRGLVPHHRGCGGRAAAQRTRESVLHDTLVILMSGMPIIIEPAQHRKHRRRLPICFLLSRSPSCPGQPTHHLQVFFC